MNDATNIAAFISFVTILCITLWDFVAKIRLKSSQRRASAYTITFHDYNRLKVKADRLDMIATLVYFLGMDYIYECRQHNYEKSGLTHESLLEAGHDINFYHKPSQRLVCTISKNN